MSFVLQPWQFLLMILAGWVNRQQQQVIDYLRTENRVLKEKLGRRRILLNDDQRRRLAVKGKVLGRKVLEEIGTLVTPDTILRWHRMLVAKKWDYSDRRAKVGRPAVSQAVVALVLRMARENPSWGYDRLQGALANLGHRIAPSTVANILKEHGIEPAPERKRQTTWRTFLKAHWDCLGAIDFTTIEVWTKGGLVTYSLLFVMHVASRRVHFAGCTINPMTGWMKQIGRNLTDPFDGFLLKVRYLLMDRDGKYCPEFRALLTEAGVNPLRLPPRSPNLTPHIERFMRSIKAECLERMIFFGERSLRQAIHAFCEHYHHERNHQGLENRLIEPGAEVGRKEGEVICSERLGGMLRYYRRAA
ncbi:MAG: integrase core domain-containing protein [Planctomycetes bacterium]|nr:integrase core domain-containing protein [Planctomycetota bacterium]